MRSEPNAGSGQTHVVDRLAEYFSNSLPPADDLVIEAHLLTCPACRGEYEELGDAVVLVALGSLEHINDGPQPGNQHTPTTQPPAAAQPSPKPGPDHSHDHSREQGH